MTELATPNAKQLTEKKYLASYVHDACELEGAVYTLNKLEEQVYADINNCRKSVEKQKKPFYDACNKADSELENEKQLAEYKKRKFLKAKNNLENPPPLPKHKFSEYVAGIFLSVLGGVFGGGFLATILYLIIALPVGLIFDLPVATESVYAPIMIALWASIAFVIFITGSIYCILDENGRPKREYDESVKKLQEEYDLASKELEDQYQKVRDAEQVCKKAEEDTKTLSRFDLEIQPQIAAYNDQIAFLQSRKAELQGKLSEFYSIGVIPPDYRHIDCVIMLDHFFRNDLVNTMQEAVRYYNHKLEIKEIVRGLDNICTAVNQLNATMQSVYMQLREIDNNMYSMHRDLINTLDRQAYQNEETTKELLEESRAGRYATEQLNKTNEKILWYKQQEYYKNNQ